MRAELRSHGWSPLWALAATTALLVTGCPSNYGFVVQVSNARKTPVKVVAMQPASLGPNDLAPLPGARIMCVAPCEAPNSVSDIDGRGFLAFGAGYSSPDPIVVKVTAPGFLPVEFTVDDIPHDSQVGPTTFIVVMKPDPNAAPLPHAAPSAGAPAPALPAPAPPGSSAAPAPGP